MAEPFISVVVPVHNGATTIDRCLAAATSVDYPNFEVVVVDDGSTDGTADIVRRHRVKLVQLKPNRGASAARNAGVAAASGEYVFFTDDDCVVQPDTLRKAARAIAEEGRDCVIGGTYTPLAHDHGLYNSFQSVFIHYSETKYREPDYIATHAMLIPRQMFLDSKRFDEGFLPILEDVDFCHRMRREGKRLVMRPELVVGHIFQFDLWRSLRNAYRKSRWWVTYSLANKDLLADSGTASVELKTNVVLWPFTVASLALAAVLGAQPWAWVAAALLLLNLSVSRGLVAAYIRARGGIGFTSGALLYYLFVYPIAVGLGGLRGLFGRR